MRQKLGHRGTNRRKIYLASKTDDIVKEKNREKRRKEKGDS